MDKMKQETADLTQENIARIGELFPNVITEMKDENGKLKKGINFDLLKQELSGDVVDGEESYDFTWVGKKASIVEANTPIRKTLRPCIEESKNWETTENLYIEGENLDVLKLLQESYLNSVKMIYIDPPYNTGKDFIYRDKFMMDKEEYEEQLGMYDEEENRLFKNTDTNGRFHSDWCSMMYSRLKLARTLLSEDGLIFINIDENEVINLFKLCSEIFGDHNNLGIMIWDKRNPKGDARGISSQHEYFVVFSKNKNECLVRNSFKRLKKNARTILDKATYFYSKVSNSYSLENANLDFARWIASEKDFSGGERAYNRIDEDGNVYRAVSMAWPNKQQAPREYFIPLIHPKTKKPCPVPARGWRNPPETMNLLVESNRVLFGPDESTQPTRKYLLCDNMLEKIPSVVYFGGSDTELLKTLDIPFDTPKVLKIVSEHISCFTKENDIILDFFSGSATTAHAVMQLNAEDGGNRKFIMVQLPEPCDEKSEAFKAGFKNICEIGKERIRRAGDQINEEIEEGNRQLKLGEEPKKPVDIGFRVLKTDTTNMKDIYYAASEYTQNLLTDQISNIKEDRTDLDLLYGVLLEWGLPLSLKHEIEEIDGVKIHVVDNDSLIACFAESVSETVVREIAKRQPLRAVFRDSSFASSSDKINVEEIFKLLAPNTSVKVI